MIKKLQERKAVELFTRIYAHSERRTLIIDDGTQSGWKETDRFPSIGECELVIKDIQVPKHLNAFISSLHDYYANKREETFFYFEEEYVKGREAIEIECDLSSLVEIVSFVDDGPNFNAILFDASLTWVLKFHHESIGYFSGIRELCDRLRNSGLLTHLVADPVWL